MNFGYFSSSALNADNSSAKMASMNVMANHTVNNHFFTSFWELLSVKKDHFFNIFVDDFISLGRNDYFDMFAPKCAGCNRAIMENYISALNAQWHADCFVCRVCDFSYFYFFSLIYFSYGKIFRLDLLLANWKIEIRLIKFVWPFDVWNIWREKIK